MHTRNFEALEAAITNFEAAMIARDHLQEARAVAAQELLVAQTNDTNAQKDLDDGIAAVAAADAEVAAALKAIEESGPPKNPPAQPGPVTMHSKIQV